ncbi:hypothetical protein PQX77_021004 [Marasmius sp. AFHP31]|nr:hypothetical protein PQX77_021004 [Marasmius sp. AFHP31]
MSHKSDKAPYTYPAQQGPTNNIHDGKNTNFGNAIQNFNHGRDLVQNNAGGRIDINNRSRYDSDEEDDNEDQPLDAVTFKRELKAFRRQYPLDPDELKKLDGQSYLDRWQRLIITALSGELTLGSSKADILDAMVQLSNVSGLSPKCLQIRDVGIEVGDPIQDAQPRSVEVFKGKVGTQEVLVKVLKKQRDVGDLKMLLNRALNLQTLEHSNILPFLGLYYFDESCERLCVVYPWMEQHGFDGIDPEDGEADQAKVSPETLNKYAQGAVDGLKYIHECKIIHGDLQNSSFSIDRNDVTRIADLGLAQMLGEDVGKNEDTDRYQCLFGGQKVKKPKDGTATKAYPRPPQVADALWELLEKWLSQDRTEHPATS